VLDEVCGGHLMPGVTFSDLTRLWFWLALGTWLLTIMTYRYIEPRIGRSKRYNPALSLP
jgi:hypothetical protein